MEPIFIPLGTRCSAAFVIRDNLNKRKYAFPFDWLDMPFTAISKFISVNHKDISEFIETYFDEMGTAHIHPDGTWFPHDIEFVDGRYWVLKPGTRDKFAKRLKRLLELLTTGGKFIFLSVIIKNGKYDEKDFLILKRQIECMVGKENATFVTINLGAERIVENHYNFEVFARDDDEGYKRWEKEIAEKINSIGIS